jgi:hypothetical protein
MSPEDAMDWFRAEGGWEPVLGTVQPEKGTTYKVGHMTTKVGQPGKFLNQCNRCLDFVQAARKELGARSRTWLCQSCDGPNPKAVVIAKSQTFWEWLREGREALKEVEKERKKREREEARAARELVRVHKANARKAGQRNVAGRV